MPVEIKELIIRAVVSEGKQTAPSSAAAESAVGKKLAKVVKEILKQNKKNER